MMFAGKKFLGVKLPFINVYGEVLIFLCLRLHKNGWTMCSLSENSLVLYYYIGKLYFSVNSHP